MKNTLFSAVLFSLGTALSTLTSAAASDPLVGTWKTIDDRTGYSLSDVVIRKNKDNQYSATIISTRSIPGASEMTLCEKCEGAQKNTPLVGLTTLTGLTANPGNNKEFAGGNLLDPKSGQHYNARARLMNNGKHLIIYSSQQGAAVGRNITWVKD
ncbi:DUF2147 domain-containing protein [Acinetobacter tianfuensis]|uniref:DUF2147 domain-containing protein n=1 Tax=Acinetobacter tianfuensis TaxID=2419603 RepID=A0A3A8ES92_9GAMM|nr:DUF2147 domain-containing protein [Acinetobacter tianfuensis]RKG31293.1 DUF2147 domain-containing protein [Acinetobacter tianfuensis]